MTETFNRQILTADFRWCVFSASFDDSDLTERTYFFRKSWKLLYADEYRKKLKFSGSKMKFFSKRSFSRGLNSLTLVTVLFTLVRRHPVVFCVSALLAGRRYNWNSRSKFIFCFICTSTSSLTASPHTCTIKKNFGFLFGVYQYR